MSSTGSIDFEPLAGNHSEAAAIIEVGVPVINMVFVVDWLRFAVNTDVVALSVANGGNAEADQGSEKHIVSINRDLVARVERPSGMIVPIVVDDMAVETMVGTDIDEIKVETDNGGTDTHTDIGKVPSADIGKVGNITVTH